MFASALPGDTAKRTLAPDDKQAVCDIYPIASDPMLCPVKDEAPPKLEAAPVAARRGRRARGAALAALAALALAALVRRPRVRRR